MIRTSVALCYTGIIAVSVLGHAQAPAFRVSVNLVRVDALVIDHNKPVLNLIADDFEVLDNGQQQRIEAAFAETAPLDLYFVFDRSGSVQGETLAQLKQAAYAGLDQLSLTDRAALLTFDYAFHLRPPLTTDLASVRMAIDRMEPGGATALFDALYAALTLAESSPRRTLVLLFTDGRDNFSYLSERDVLNVARRSDAVVYAVAFKSPYVAGPDEPVLHELAGASGGRVVLVDEPDRLKTEFVSVLREMRSRYLLMFSPTALNAIGWHKLTVRLKHRSGRVIARSGYFVRDLNDSR
jgi:Ca-activated chloride channel family protein